MLNSGVNMLNPMEKSDTMGFMEWYLLPSLLLLHSHIFCKRNHQQCDWCVSKVSSAYRCMFLYIQISDARYVSPKKWHNTTDLFTGAHDNYRRRKKCSKYRRKRHESFASIALHMLHVHVHNAIATSFISANVIRLNLAIACHSIIISFPKLPLLVDFDSFKWKHIKNSWSAACN